MDKHALYEQLDMYSLSFVADCVNDTSRPYLSRAAISDFIIHRVTGIPSRSLELDAPELEEVKQVLREYVAIRKIKGG